MALDQEGGKMIKRYGECYRECSEWLAQVFVPWRWIVIFHEECAALRQELIT